MRFDIHVHTDFSLCSAESVHNIIKAASEKGLDGVCITDHHSMEAGQYIKEGLQENGLVVIVGMEYTTPGGDFLVFGNFSSIEQGLSAEELLYTVSEADGIAVAAHPLRNERPVKESVFEKGLCSVIESVNGRNTPEENNGARLLLEKYDLKAAAGSDAHTLPELGRAVTVFHQKILSSDDLIRAFRSGVFSAEEDLSAALCL